MLNFDRVLRQMQVKEFQDTKFWRQVEAGVFEEHRDRLISAYCATMRLHDEFAARNKLLPMFPPIYPEGVPSRNWCNAAALVLTHATVDIQKRFLISQEIADRMVQAVLDDDGMETEAGTWMELPV